MRTRLARALEADSPDTARLIMDGQTTLNDVPLDGLTGWTLVDVQNRKPPHPRRIAVALSDAGAATVLSGDPEAFNTVVGGSVGTLTAARATKIAQVFFDLTRDFTVWSYRVESTDDIQWLPKPKADQAKRRDALITEFGDRIKPPAAEAEGQGWSLTLWSVSGNQLVQHDLVIAADGTVNTTSVVAAENVPVPASA